jgi:hypothetical protein
MTLVDIDDNEIRVLLQYHMAMTAQVIDGPGLTKTLITTGADPLKNGGIQRVTMLTNLLSK